MSKRAAIYVRVSTDKQTVENQVRELRQIADRRGWEVVEQYSDAGISGSKGRDGRPSLDLILNDAKRRKFDVVMASSRRHAVVVLDAVRADQGPLRREARRRLHHGHRGRGQGRGADGRPAGRGESLRGDDPAEQHAFVYRAGVSRVAFSAAIARPNYVSDVD
jgi:hypothetical protein